MTPDFINGLFEFFGAAALMGNVKAIIDDKAVKGVNWKATAFFTTWGLWNLFYYPSLEQWFSFAGGTCIVLVNLAWLSLAWRYRAKT